MQEEIKNKILELYKKGYSLNKIALEVKYSVPAIKYVIQSTMGKCRNNLEVRRLNKLDVVIEALKQRNFNTKISYFANMKMLLKYIMRKYQSREELIKEIALLFEIDEREQKLQEFVDILLQHKELIMK